MTASFAIVVALHLGADLAVAVADMIVSLRGALRRTPVVRIASACLMSFALARRGDSEVSPGAARR
jgi:hypothetical protein